MGRRGECERCGAGFDARRGGRAQKYCSLACRGVARELRRKPRRAAPRSPVPPPSGAERWAPSAVEGYYVSDAGRVWSTLSGRVMSPGMAGPRRNYACVSLTVAPSSKVMRSVHRLVLVAFVGPCPEGHEAAHLNGLSADNRLSNLAWATPSENNRHKSQHGTQRRGESVVGSRLTADDVIAARAARRSGEAIGDIAQRYGIDRGAMGLVLNGRRWSHVPGAIPPRSVKRASPVRHG